jgi:phospholipase A2
MKFDRRQDIHPEPEDDPGRFQRLYAQIYDGRFSQKPEKVLDSYGKQVTNPPAAACNKECTMVYLPVLPNQKAVPDFDPSTANFSGSYNLVWTPEQVEMLIKVATANSAAGETAIKEALREAWQRRKHLREQKS